MVFLRASLPPAILNGVNYCVILRIFSHFSALILLPSSQQVQQQDSPDGCITAQQGHEEKQREVKKFKHSYKKGGTGNGGSPLPPWGPDED